MEPHIILSLQVPGFLAQEAEDIGEVFVADLIEDLRGDQAAQGHREPCTPPEQEGWEGPPHLVFSIEQHLQALV